MSAAAGTQTERREAALREVGSARRGAREITEALALAHGPYAHRLTRHLALYRAALGEALARYEAELPRPVLARCPFTGEEARHSLDTTELDGPWWDYERPARPVERLPATWVAMTGSLGLAEPLPRTDALVVPGPAEPFVIPRLLDDEAVRAVLSTVAIGAHQGYAITYFAQSAFAGTPVNTWGSAEYRVAGASLTRRDLPHGEADYDFALAPWIERGDLLWVEPGDESVELRSGTTACPYLELAGAQRTQHLQYGEVWTVDRRANGPSAQG